mgnify:CR=1 FL=1
MASAIELYRRAYDLDYRKGDWETAERLYHEIMERYPYSDEKEYAQVHLERIAQLKADPHNQELAPVRGGAGPHALAIVSFVLVLILLAAVGVLGYTGWRGLRYHRHTQLVLEGLLSERIGDLKGARDHYKEAQELLPEDRFGYRLMAELYMKIKDYELARIEAKRWALAAPKDPELKMFRARLESLRTPVSSTVPDDSGEQEK